MRSVIYRRRFDSPNTDSSNYSSEMIYRIGTTTGVVILFNVL